MNINNENIEAYLLLLVDNELTAAEREEVLLFIEDDDDYQILLSQFQAAILEVDDALIFEDKASLLKQEEKVVPFFNLRSILKYAAALIVLVGINFLVKQSLVKHHLPIENNVATKVKIKQSDTNRLTSIPVIAVSAKKTKHYHS